MRPLPQAASAGRVARVDCLLVGAENDPVFFRREIRAVGGVEFVGVDVADELHRLGRLRVSGFADWLSQVNVTSFPSVQATTVPSSSVRRMVTPACFSRERGCSWGWP